MSKKYKCLGPDCKEKIEEDYLFCSFECACYANCFNVRTGYKYDEMLKLAKKKKRSKIAEEIKTKLDNLQNQNK